jgi:O-succinylbenzoic acid--CoA ligase
MNCPLKDAARDAPNALAILSQSRSWTFAELDRYADQIADLPLMVEATPSFHLIASFFAAWRRQTSLFLLNPRAPRANAPVDAPPASVLLYTSGSTATPKIALLPFASLLANAKGAIQPLDLKPHDQWRLTLPLYHVSGIGIVLRCILARATIVLDDSPDITHLSYVPTHLYRATPVYKRLRCLLLGGAPIASYPSHLPVRITYGLTEMGSMVTLDGRVLPGREVRIADDAEIWVRGDCLFAGYLDEERPRDWFPTKDLGRFNANGLQILGRKDWMFISGGENIQPEEIERELLALPEVVDAAVLPVDDVEFGKRPVAVVQASEDFDLKKMQIALQDKLPKYKIPIALYLVSELPKKNNLKTDRFILSQLVKNQVSKNTSGQKNRAYL